MFSSIRFFNFRKPSSHQIKDDFCSTSFGIHVGPGSVFLLRMAMILPTRSQDNLMAEAKVETDDAEETEGDLAQILQTLMHQKVAFAHFAEQQELLVNQVMERVNSRYCANNADAIEAKGIAIGAISLPSDSVSECANAQNSLGQTSVGQLTTRTAKTAAKSISSSVQNGNAKKVEKFKREIDDKVANQEYTAKQGICVRFLHSPVFEMCTGAVVVLHIIVMGIQFQFRSYELQDELNGRGDGRIEEPMVFDFIEMGFNGMYLMELAARLSAFGFDYFKHSPLINTADTVIVFLCCFASFILKPMDIDMGGGTLALARVVRMARILKVLRAFRVFNVLTMFTELRVIIQTLMSAFSRTLLWSSVVIGFTVFVASILLCTLTAPTIEDESLSIAKRQYLFDHYGSAARASYTLFEATFTGRWGIHAKKLIFEYSPMYAVIYALFVLAVNFAMIRVIAAIFLKQTMDHLHLDAERKAMQQTQEMQMKTQMLRDMYHLVDQNGNGLIELDELREMTKSPFVKELFDRLDLGEDEVYALFDYISDNGAEVDFEEFLQSVLRLKGNVHVADVIQLQHELMKALAGIEQIKQLLSMHRSHMSPVHVFTACSTRDLQMTSCAI